MSVFDEDIRGVHAQQQIDRLVDGELSEADRRQLLLHLEREPDGWRRCALAFLEAQCWKAELSQVSAPTALSATTGAGERSETAVSSVTAKTADDSTGRRQTWRQYVATFLTLSASFLLALTVGMGLRGNWSGISSHSPEGTGTKMVRDEFPLDVDVTAATPVAPVAQPAATAGAPLADSGGGWEMVTLASGKSTDGRSDTYYCLPAQRRDALDQSMLEHASDAIPPEMRQAFERSGHRIVEQREIVPVEMKDGRRLIVPVDHVEIRYVGRPSL